MNPERRKEKKVKSSNLFDLCFQGYLCESQKEEELSSVVLVM